MVYNTVNAQRTITPSDTLKIKGKIKAGTTFTIADLEIFQKVERIKTYNTLIQKAFLKRVPFFIILALQNPQP